MATLVSPDTSGRTSDNHRAFPAPATHAWGRPRTRRHAIGEFERNGQYVIDTRSEAPDMFHDVSTNDWSKLTWSDVGRPYRVEKWARSKH